MIKIPGNAFQWDILEEIYGKDGPLAQNLCSAISTVMGQKTPAAAACLLAQWFYENGAPSAEKISAFLTNRRPLGYIREYAETLCDTLWSDKSYAAALIRLPSAIKEAAEQSNILDRVRILSGIVTPKSLNRFVLKQGAVVRPLTKADIDPARSSGTLYSSRSRLKQLRLSAQPYIDAVNAAFSTIFDYDAFADEYRDRLLEAMGVSVCPYCNRQYITMYAHGDIQKATADVDHFYSKSRYPFLALSLYNFVPACPICNSRLKLTADFAGQPHVNPHERGFDGDARFWLRDPMCINNRALPPDCELINADDDPEIARSIRTFRLNAVYERSHGDYVRELIDKARIYQDALLEEYLSNFKGLFPGGEEQMRRLLYGNYLTPDNACQRPLAKLTQDLLYQLGVLDDPYL